MLQNSRVGEHSIERHCIDCQCIYLARGGKRITEDGRERVRRQSGWRSKEQESEKEAIKPRVKSIKASREGGRKNGKEFGCNGVFLGAASRPVATKASGFPYRPLGLPFLVESWSPLTLGEREWWGYLTTSWTRTGTRRSCSPSPHQ